MSVRLFIAMLLISFSVSLFATEYNVLCEGKRYTSELTLPDREKVTLSLNRQKPAITKEAWVFAMNRRGEAIVPEELGLNLGMTNEIKLEIRFENLRLCGDIEGVRVRVYELTGNDRTFLEETGCSCKAK